MTDVAHVVEDGVLWHIENQKGEILKTLDKAKFSQHDAIIYALGLNSAERIAQLTADAHNLKSPVHAICNQNLTETLAAALEQTQTISRMDAELKRVYELVTHWSGEARKAGAERDVALRECEQWKTWGVIEIAIRNVNVSSYMEHWEGRAIKAEAELSRLKEEVDLTKQLDKAKLPCGHNSRYGYTHDGGKTGDCCICELSRLKAPVVIEKLACAIWAKEKCTTRYGIDIDAWESMHPDPKRKWIERAQKHYANRSKPPEEPK